MVGVKETISTVIVALAVAPVVHADMMPVSPPQGGSRWSLSVCGQKIAPQPGDSQGSTTFGATVELDLVPVGSLPAVKPDAASAGAAQHLEILTDKQNSLSLCLYALLGLGLCRSATLARKFHFSWFPDWYYTGGARQTGHRFAIPPDCLLSALVYCFIQPDSATATEDTPVTLRQGIVASLWRQSQFTRAVAASRGPPYVSRKAIVSRTALWGGGNSRIEAVLDASKNKHVMEG